jgi:hypothetical protein
VLEPILITGLVMVATDKVRILKPNEAYRKLVIETFLRTQMR